MLTLDDIFKKDGLLSKQLSGYKPRPGQIGMAKAVESAIRDQRHLFDEAPTGTGKSLAYGIPAALHALSSGQRVVIATANITLQEQLAKKDLPLIVRMLEGQEVNGERLPTLRFVSRKGLGNYVCLYKLDEERQRRRNALAWAKDLWKWVQKHDEGDREELPTHYDQADWNKVCASSDECHRNRCRFFNECYALKSRLTEDAHIIVTNYHLLYADAVVKEATGGQAMLLGEYDVVVMDEAHEAVDIAMGFQGFELTVGSIYWLTKRLNKLTFGLEDDIAGLEAAGRRFFNKLESVYGRRKDMIIRQPLGFDENLVNELEGMVGALKDFLKDAAIDKDKRGQVIQVGNVVAKKRAQFERVCFGMPSVEGPRRLPRDSVFYAEESASRRFKGLSLCSKVVEVQSFLRFHFLDRVTLVCTSATMATNGNFNFIAEEFGLEDDEYASMISPSPFDPRNMLVVVPEDFPSPKSRDQHIRAVAGSICDIVSELGGRSMALFASYRSLRFVSEYLEENLEGVRILVQGQMQKSKIIQAMKEDEGSLILATASFWQGVDIPGRALSCLFIEKFPFAPPTDPIVSYMNEKMERETGNSFASFIRYSVPKAAIAMKQGVGRLIRTESDYGVVVIFDNRLEKASYGSHFECAFPDDHFRSGDLEDVVHFLEDMDDQETAH